MAERENTTIDIGNKIQWETEPALSQNPVLKISKKPRHNFFVNDNKKSPTVQDEQLHTENEAKMRFFENSADTNTNDHTDLSHDIDSVRAHKNLSESATADTASDDIAATSSQLIDTIELNSQLNLLDNSITALKNSFVDEYFNYGNPTENLAIAIFEAKIALIAPEIAQIEATISAINDDKQRTFALSITKNFLHLKSLVDNFIDLQAATNAMTQAIKTNAEKTVQLQHQITEHSKIAAKRLEAITASTSGPVNSQQSLLESLNSIESTLAQTLEINVKQPAQAALSALKDQINQVESTYQQLGSSAFLPAALKKAYNDTLSQLEKISAANANVILKSINVTSQNGNKSDFYRYREDIIAGMNSLKAAEDSDDLFAVMSSRFGELARKRSNQKPISTPTQPNVGAELDFEILAKRFSKVKEKFNMEDSIKNLVQSMAGTQISLKKLNDLFADLDGAADNSENIEHELSNYTAYIAEYKQTLAELQQTGTALANRKINAELDACTNTIKQLELAHKSLTNSLTVAKKHSVVAQLLHKVAELDKLTLELGNLPSKEQANGHHTRTSSTYSVQAIQQSFNQRRNSWQDEYTAHLQMINNLQAELSAQIAELDQLLEKTDDKQKQPLNSLRNELAEYRKKLQAKAQKIKSPQTNLIDKIIALENSKLNTQTLHTLTSFIGRHGTKDQITDHINAHPNSKLLLNAKISEIKRDSLVDDKISYKSFLEEYAPKVKLSRTDSPMLYKIAGGFEKFAKLLGLDNLHSKFEFLLHKPKNNSGVWYEQLPPRYYQQHLHKMNLLTAEQPSLLYGIFNAITPDGGFSTNPSSGKVVYRDVVEGDPVKRFVGKSKISTEKQLKSAWFNNFAYEFHQLENYRISFEATMTSLLKLQIETADEKFLENIMPILASLSALQDQCTKQQRQVNIMLTEFSTGKVSKVFNGKYNDEFNDEFSQYIEQGMIKSLSPTVSNAKKTNSSTEANTVKQTTKLSFSISSLLNYESKAKVENTQVVDAVTDLNEARPSFPGR